VSNLISVIIPNYNGNAYIEKCLEAVFSSRYENCSEDNSVEIIKRFPCKLIRLERHEGASKARNIGALNSKGDVLFFIDADCLLKEDTLSIVGRSFSSAEPGTVIGGTYTRVPFDRGFFSIFQSVFINYSETRKADGPDYVAAHAMIISARTFRKSRGFPEDFMPILEDVELSHRLRRQGCRLIMNPEIQVQHIFNFTLPKSLRNAMRKSMYWIMYSLKNRDMFADSGAASSELKINVVSFFLSLLFLILWIIMQQTIFLLPLILFFIFNVLTSRLLLKAYYETGGILFALLAFMYYTMLYPLPVGTGIIAGTVKYFLATDLHRLKTR